MFGCVNKSISIGNYTGMYIYSTICLNGGYGDMYPMEYMDNSSVEANADASSVAVQRRITTIAINSKGHLSTYVCIRIRFYVLPSVVLGISIRRLA